MSHIEFTQRGIDCRPLKKEKVAAIRKHSPKRPKILAFRPFKVMKNTMMTIGLAKVKKRSNKMANKKFNNKKRASILLRRCLDKRVVCPPMVMCINAGGPGNFMNKI
jgi:hypothetical protein